MIRPVDLASTPPVASGTVTARPGTAPTARDPRWWASGAVVVLALVSMAVRLPLTARPLSSDEGGFLMVAGQWAHGTSLYGNYWVDRPPLLITLCQVAQGSATGLRLLGAASVGTSVLLAGALARAALRLASRPTPRRSAAAIGAAAAAAAFLVSPLFGALEVDGEILAVPFVLAGLTATLTAYAARRHRAEWWIGAGFFAAAAAGVKQSMLEVFVAAAVLLAITAASSRASAVRAAAAFGTGALAGAVVLLGWAALHGTTPGGLWDAVVSFRFEATSVIAHFAPSTDRGRAGALAGACLGSGAAAVVLVGMVPVPRGRGPRPSATLLAVTASVLAWEGLAVVAGGSYWLHYLVGTVPGLVLAAVVAVARGRGYLLGAVLTYAGAVAIAGLVAMMTTPVGTSASGAEVERYLSAHSRPGDTGVTAFGDPALLQAAHLPSPYPQLWSLPVRVRDPRLVGFVQVLQGPERPTWVVVDGESLASWGIDPTSAEPVLERHYRLVHSAGDWHVYRQRTHAR